MGLSDCLHHFCLSPFRLSGIPHLTQGCGWYGFSPVDLKSLYSMNRSFRHRRSVWNLTMMINPHVGFCSGNSIALLVRKYFGAQYLSLLSRCLRLAPNVTISNPKLTSGGVVSSFPDRISTCIIPSPFRAHCLTPSAIHFGYRWFSMLNMIYLADFLHLSFCFAHFSFLLYLEAWMWRFHSFILLSEQKSNIWLNGIANDIF